MTGHEQHQAAATPPDDMTVLSLCGEQTIDSAEQTCRALRSALAGARCVRLDCSEVTAADVTLPQLLIAARRSACVAGKELELAAVSPALARVLRTLGLAGEGEETSWLEGIAG